MPDSEFDIIEQVFRARARAGQHVVHGIGDDAAVVEVPAGRQLVVSTDTLVGGVHFFIDADPFDVGYKSLAVNLSDIAAMGADPLWMTLSLTLPAYDPDWLQRYADGLFTLADQHEVALIGGNMARGPLSISITIMGTVAAGQALLRSTARPNDDIYITGQPGMAALALSILTRETPWSGSIPQDCLERLLRPQPRLQAGCMIRPYASACIDISDGLAADLGHILDASGTGARIDLTAIPLHDALCGMEPLQIWARVLWHGDDYELCFTAPPQHRQVIARLGNDTGCKISRIGQITAKSGIVWLAADGGEIPLDLKGYRHF